VVDSSFGSERNFLQGRRGSRVERRVFGPEEREKRMEGEWIDGFLLLYIGE
jgi:hypothetical protein